MTDLVEILGDEAKGFKKRFPSVAEYIEKYYVINWEADRFEFDFEKNDSVLSCSIGSNHFESMPHASSHINKDVEWAKEKMLQEKNSSAHPSWFGTTEETSQLIIRTLTNEQIAEKIETWANDRNIYYYDKTRCQKTIVFNLNKKTTCGRFIVRGVDKVFKTNAIKIVLEYTQFLSDGPFIIYTAYPYVSDDIYKRIIEKYR